MKRKELEDLGLNKEQVDAVIKMNGADIENAKSVSAAEISNLQTENESLTSQVKERDKQLETLKKSAGDNEDLQKQIEQLQSDNATAKANHESEMNQLKVQFAVEKALTGAEAKNIKAVKALLELGEAKLDKDGNVKAAKCVKLDWKKNPETGRMTMTEIEGSEYIVDCDVVLIAAGFLGCQTYVAESFGVELNERTNVKTPCPNSYTTNVPKVFVAGDMHRGQSLVVWAIREGREAAMAVEELLLGYTNLQ